MKIVILGAGRVGASLAEQLVSERNDVTVIDEDLGPLSALQERFDLRTVRGNGVHPSTLRDAGADDADMLIAVTQSDEVNLAACAVGAKVFNVPNRIARVRASEFQDHPQLTGTDGFCVDHLICPEQTVTETVKRLIEFPEALQVLDFAGGRVSLIAVRAFAGGPLVSKPIKELPHHLPGIDSRIVAIFRAGKSILPDGDTMVEPGDEVFFLAASKDIRQVMAELRRMDKPTRRIMIAGGGNIGLRLARALENDYPIKLIEQSKERCEYLASQLNSRTLVLHGDATDEDLLTDENVDEMDLFLSLTSDDENNIMSTLLAKRMGARRVIALINRKAYADLMEGGRIDIAISPAHSTLGELLRYIRRGDIVAVHSLRRGAAEALEVIAHGDPKTSRVVGRKIEDLDLPAGSMIGAIVREKPSVTGPEHQVIIAHHDTVIESDDHLIVFVANKRMIRKVEQMFQVSVRFF